MRLKDYIILSNKTTYQRSEVAGDFPIFQNPSIAWYHLLLTVRMSCNSLTEIEDLFPCVAAYCPTSVSGLQVGQVLKWCTCGLSKKQPWCDSSHVGTPFKPLTWTVPGTIADGRPQKMYSVCLCKHTKSPPYCDGSHTSLPLRVKRKQQECKKDHSLVKKICSSCGYIPHCSGPTK